MARKYLTSIDLVKNELQNAVVQNLATAPSSPAAGQIYFDTAVNELLVWNGTAWRQSDGISTGLLSARPAAATANSGTFFYATDNFLTYYSNGTTWQQVSAFGSSASTTVTIAGTAADGTSTNYARADHTHAGPGFGTATGTTSYGLTAANGSATTVSRSDHTHGTPSLGTATPSAITVAGTGSAGSATAPSKEDHTHAGPGFAASTATTTYGLTKADGSATTIARSDHTHGTPALSANAATNISATTAANGTGTAPAKDDHVHGFTPSGFAISAFGSAAANVNLNSNKIINLATPTADTDAATKLYVDNVAQGLNIHAASLAATTTALTATYSNGTAGVGATLTNSGTQAAFVVDGVTPIVGDRILVKNQATAAQNGIYTVTNTGSVSTNWVLTRATDFDTAIEIAGGDFTFVDTGTTLANTGWVTSAEVTTVGTDAVSFIQFSGAGTYTASNGVLLTGNNFTFAPSTTGGLQTGAGGGSIKLATNSGAATDANGFAIGAGNGIVVGTSTISVDTAVVARKYAVTLSTSATSYTITHNLGTLDVIVQVYTVADGSEVIVDNLRATTNTVTLAFNVAPTSNAYRVVVLG